MMADAGSTPTPTPDASTGGAMDSGVVVAIDAGSTGGGQDASVPCYSEPYSPNVNLDDLKNGYDPSAWLSTALTVMQRRYPSGHFILNAEMSDPNLPSAGDGSTWDGLMFSMESMLHDESLQYDADQSQSGSSYTYVLRNDLTIAPSTLSTWPRGEIMSLITDTATQAFDRDYLQGGSGNEDVVFLADDWNAFTNGLAAITAVGEQVSSPTDARDGVAACLYYVELYLKIGRTNHPQAYAALKASPDWQKLVRYQWARGFFWDKAARAFPNLATMADPIWAHVNDPQNLDEIKQFTGDDASEVACHP
jgi:hypothetical protein